MSDETESRSNSPETPQPMPEPSGPTPAKARPALLYIGVMFAVALLLLLMSFLMQQRNHEALMESVGSVQAVADLELENQKLTQKVADLEETLEETQMALEYSDHAVDQLKSQRIALHYLLEIRHLFDAGDLTAARLLLPTLTENGGYGVYLSQDEPVDGLQTFAEIYEALRTALAE